MGTNNTIFDLADQFNIQSPFGDWQEDIKKGFIEAVNLPSLLAYIKLAIASSPGNRTRVFDYVPYVGTGKMIMLGAEVDGVPQTIPFFYRSGNPGEEPRQLNITPQINIKKGKIDFGMLGNIKLEFDLAGEKINAFLYFTYTLPAGTTDEDKYAIILCVHNYQDFIDLLRYLDYPISASTITTIKKHYSEAFQKGKGKADVIDWLYEQAPAFVLSERPDQQLWDDFVLLSNASIDNSGTNENTAVLNLVAAIKDRKWFFNKIDTDPTAIRKLFDRFDGKYIPNLIIQFILAGLGAWTKDDYTNASRTYYVFGISEFDFDGDGYSEIQIAGTCVYVRHKNKYEVGVNIHEFKRPSIAASKSTHRVLGQVRPSAPLSIKMEGGEMYIPAFVGEYFTNEKIDEQRKLAINNALAFVLPQVAIRLKTLADLRNSAKIKLLKSIDELVDFLSNIKEGFRAIDLEKAGIKVLFRGTTRNLEGRLFLGNSNAQVYGISTSTDPIRATIFGIESTSIHGGKGVMQVAVPENLKNITLVPGSRRVPFELEVTLKIDADSFAKLVTKRNTY